jgi:AraC-like DNA-binding protein
MDTIFSTDVVPPADRLALFDEFQRGSTHPMRALSSRPDEFRATVRAVQLGTVDVVELALADSTIVRSAQLIRQDDPDVYAIVLPLSGRVALSQARRDTLLQPGSMALYNSAKPFEVHISGDAAPATLMRVQIPSSLLPPTRSRWDQLLAVPLSGQRGVGNLFTRFLTGLGDAYGEFHPTDLPRLGNLAADMFSAVLAHHLESEIASGPPRDLLRHRITAYMREHLDDPWLSPETVAAAHHISVSYLHRLFETRDLTVSAWIRNQRLDRARRDLSDPQLADLPIYRIANRWGFRDHATFTRSFRAEFGLPPRRYRQDRITPHLASGQR